jgi:hypothetical protein
MNNEKISMDEARMRLRGFKLTKLGHKKIDGWDPILYIDDKQIGIVLENKSLLFVGLKKDFLKSLIKENNIKGLEILKEYQDSDLHIVFDAIKYVEHEVQKPRSPKPIVHLIIDAPRDVNLISTKLGYPILITEKHGKS